MKLRSSWFAFALSMLTAASAIGCSSGEPSDTPSVDEGALETPADRGTIRHGVYEYRYRAREGLIKRLVLREDGTFERAEWRKSTTRLAASTTKGTFETFQRRLPAGIGYRLKLKPTSGAEEVYRFAMSPEGEMTIMRDTDGAPQTELRMVESATGQRAVTADCKVSTMHDHTIFEESLSEDEYPDVELYKSPAGDFSEAWFGGSAYSSTEGDRIEVRTSAGGLEATVTTSAGSHHVLRVEGRVGKVLSKENGREIEVATLRCK